MAWYDFLTGKVKVKEEVINNSLEYYYYKELMGKLSKIMTNDEYRFNNSQAFIIAKTLVEVFTPIDVIADRVSGLDYYIVDKNGDRVDTAKLPKNLQRLLSKPNIFQSLQSLIYSIEFSELATGGSFIYPVFNKSVKTKNIDNLSQVYLIEPDKIQPVYKNLITAPFLAQNLNEFIEEFVVNHFGSRPINADDLIVNIDNQFNFQTLEIESPLLAVTRNIENLVVTYSARYNSYASNGAGGVISKKNTDPSGMEVFDSDQRQKMIDEMRKTDGIVGHKNFIAISSIPIEFTRTLASIKDLMPFDETMKNALAVLGVYGVSPFLTPYAEQTTFTNLEQAEESLWQNQIIPRGNEMILKLNRAFHLGDEYSFAFELSSTQILQKSRAREIESDLKEIELYEKLKEIGIEKTEILNKWID